MFSKIREEISVVFDRDPAARSVFEVVTTYPGFHALLLHRLAHRVWGLGFKWLGRFISYIARWLTGIEIHPGATIGRRFFIDHGMGVLIGETAEIGNDVLMYSGVVLGGTTLEKKKRHPTIGNDVVMGTGAIALGAITIGDGARIGAGSVVIKSVPPGVTVVGVPGRVVTKTEKPSLDLQHGRLPDPVAEAIRMVLKDQQQLEERLKRLEETTGFKTPDNQLEEERKIIEKEFSEGEGI